jgi:DNA-binding MarR family transcriptional regulator
MKRTGAGEAFTELILEVFRLNGRLLSAGDALTRPTGQTSARWQVLGALDEDARTVADIGRRMGLTRQSVQRTADLLVGRGLAEYLDNPAHRRAKLFRPTPEGYEAIRRISPGQAEAAEHLAGAVGHDDMARAVATLRRLCDALDARERQRP